MTEGNRSIAGKGPRDTLARGNPRGTRAEPQPASLRCALTPSLDQAMARALQVGPLIASGLIFE